MVPVARPPTSFAAQPFPGAPFLVSQSFPTVDINALSMFPVSGGGKQVLSKCCSSTAIFKLVGPRLLEMGGVIVCTNTPT